MDNLQRVGIYHEHYDTVRNEERYDLAPNEANK